MKKMDTRFNSHLNARFSMAKKTDALTKESPEGVSFVRVGDNDYRQVCSSSNACAGVVHFLWVTWILYVIPIYMLYSYVFTNNCVSIGSILHFIWTDCICVCRLIGSGARIPIRWSMMECNIGHDMYQALTFIILCLQHFGTVLNGGTHYRNLCYIAPKFSCRTAPAEGASADVVADYKRFQVLQRCVSNAYFRKLGAIVTMVLLTCQVCVQCFLQKEHHLNETYFAGMHKNICFFYQLITYNFRFQSNFLCVNAFIYVSYFLLVFLLHLS